MKTVTFIIPPVAARAQQQIASRKNCNLDMDNPNCLILTLGKPLCPELMKTKSTFQEVAKTEFQAIQQTCKHVRSTVYRSSDEECQDGTSNVTFHSLSYVKKRIGTF